MSGRIDILYPNQPTPTLLASPKETGQRGKQRAKMQGTCGGGREAAYIHGLAGRRSQPVETGCLRDQAELTIAIVAVPELALGQFTAFLGFQ